MNHLFLLLSALTGLGVVSLTSAQKKAFEIPIDIFYYGKNYKKVFVDYLEDKVAFCFNGPYKKDAPIKECFTLKVVATGNLKQDHGISETMKSQRISYFGSVPKISAGVLVQFSTSSGIVQLNFMTFQTMSGVMLYSPAKNTELIVYRAELGKTDPKLVIRWAAIRMTSCRTKSGKIVKISDSLKIDCITYSCNYAQTASGLGVALTEASCAKNLICIESTCQKRDVCTFTGPSVVDISGQTNTIKDQCRHPVMASTKLSDFRVFGGYLDRRRKDITFLNYLVISLGSNNYKLEQGGIFKNKGTVESLSKTPKDIDGLQVSKTERGILVSYTNKGFTVEIFFDGYTAQIEVTGPSETPFGMSGLCAKATALAPEVKDSCDKAYTQTPYKADCPAVTDSCGVLKKAPFTECKDVIDPEPYVKVCSNTLCAYPSVDNLLCQFLEAYARACESKTQKKVDGWRSNSNCPAPKALCQGTSCSSKEFCGQKGDSWTCQCRPRAVESYRDKSTLGDPTTCKQNKASVSLVNCLLKEKSIDYTKLHLNDPTCKGVLSDGMVTFGFDSSKKCGTLITDSGTEVVYKNAIQSEVSTGEIVRHDIVKMEFSCSHTQPKVTDVKLSVTSSSVVATVVSGSWSYTLTMQTFSDSGLSKLASTVNMNQKVWIGLKTSGLDSALVAMVIDSCWATKTTDAKSDPKYYLIKDSCANPKDNTVKIVGNGAGTSSSFSFNAFQFSSGKSDLFLHCKVKLCGLKNGKTCVPTCGGNGRRRRSARFMDEDPTPALITMTWTS